MPVLRVSLFSANFRDTYISLKVLATSLKQTMREYQEFASQNPVYIDEETGARIKINYLLGGNEILSSKMALRLVACLVCCKFLPCGSYITIAVHATHAKPKSTKSPISLLLSF